MAIILRVVQLHNFSNDDPVVSLLSPEDLRKFHATRTLFSPPVTVRTKPKKAKIFGVGLAIGLDVLR